MYMRIWFELNNTEAERVFELMKSFSVDKLSTGVMEQPKTQEKAVQFKAVPSAEFKAEFKTEKAFETKAAEIKADTAPEKEVILEDVRAALAGKPKPEIKALLESVGASKLTEVDPSKYAELLQKVGEI